MADKKASEYCEKILSLAVDALPETLEQSSKTYRELVNCFFIKAINSFQSILLLCREDLSDDAGNILRSLFELSLFMKWVEGSKDERTGLFFDWYLKEIIELKKSLGKLPPSTVQKLWEKALPKFQFQTKKRKTKIVQAWFHSQKISSVRDLAKSVDALGHYDGYAILSKIEHSRPLTFQSIFLRTKGDKKSSYFAASPTMTSEVLFMSFQYFYISLSVWNGEFQRIDGARIGSLYTESRTHFENLRS